MFELVWTQLIYTATYEIDYYYCPILQMRPLRYRKSEHLVQGHVAGKWWSQDLNPGCLALESVLTTVLHYAVFLGGGGGGGGGGGEGDLDGL